MNGSYFFALEGDLPLGIGVDHFSTIHMLWLGSVLALIAAAALIFIRLHAAARVRVLSACAGSLLALEVFRLIWLCGTGRFDPRFMLPLHLCGIMLFVEAAAVLSGRAILRELSYCLGMPGAFFALLTPESTAYPLFNLWYLLFIAMHALLLLIPILFLLDGFYPDRRRLPACLAFLLGIMALDLVANQLLHANYLFLQKPPPGSLLALFDGVTQPMYLLGATLILLVVWGGLYLPWRCAPQTDLKKRI